MAIGKVIKGDGTPEPLPQERPALRPPRPGVMNAESFQARQEAQGIVEEANRRRAEILEEAGREREKLLAAAKQEGYQAGLAKVTDLLLKARQERTGLLARAEHDIITLACRVAEKILGSDLERDPSIVVDIVAQAMDHARSSRALILRMNPRAAQNLRDNKPKLMERIGSSKEINIKDDSDVKDDGCIIETEFGTIDATLSTQLHMILTALTADDAKKRSEPA